MLTALNGYNNKWFLYYSENITVIIKRASVATYVLCVPKICTSNAVRSSAPSAPSHPSPLPMGSVWASFTQVPLLPSRGYIRGCWWPHQSSPSGFVLREVSVHTPLPVTWKNGHQSPFSCRTQVWCASEFVDSRLGPEGDSWNKSCVYKGQLELQWQWRDWNITTVPGTSYSWPWSSAIPQELFFAHICVRPRASW